MATDVDQTFYGWSHEESSDRDETQEVSVPPVLDHGSISFGRFAIESLSWERRSVFTHNTCQEELEKFKSPGLVAKKKAYFEEYYKRIRALKAKEENQQSDLTLVYGRDDSISSQTIDEDETAIKLENHGDGASNSIGACSNEASFDVSLVNEQNCGIFPTIDSNLELTSTDIDSSGKSYVEIEHEGNTCSALQIQHLDTKSTVHEPLIRRTEEVKQHDLSGLDGTGNMRGHNDSESNVEQEHISCSTDVQMCSSDRESTAHESLVRRTEDIEEHELISLDINRISRCHDLETDCVPNAASGGNVLRHTSSKEEEVKPDYNIALEQIKPKAKKYQEDHMSVLKAKGPAASGKNGMKLECRTQSEVKSSHGPKYPFEMTICKAKNSAGSNNATTDRVSRNYRSTLVASPKPLTEVRSNVTRLRPFSLSTERRAALSAASKDVALKLDTKINRLASSLNQAKDIQGSLKKTAIAYGVKSRGLENKRGCEEVGKAALTLDSHNTSVKGRDGHLRRAPKARSVNLPASNCSNPNGGSEYRPASAARKDRWEEGKDGARPREIGGVHSKICASPRIEKPNAESKTVVQSQADHMSPNRRKPRITHVSQDGTKPRKVLPRWR